MHIVRKVLPLTFASIGFLPKNHRYFLFVSKSSERILVCRPKPINYRHYFYQSSNSNSIFIRRMTSTAPTLTSTSTSTTVFAETAAGGSEV